MKRRLIFTVFIFWGVLIPLAGAADDGSAPFLVQTMTKTFYDRGIYPARTHEAVISLITNPAVEISNHQKRILNALRYHDMLAEEFKRKGWRSIHPLDGKDPAGTIEMTFEARMNTRLEASTVIKTYLYVCERKKMWNMMKYRGGSYSPYFRKIVGKTENCILEKTDFSSSP